MFPSLQRFALACAVFFCAGASLAGQQNLGELYSTDASVKGSVVLADSGTKVMSGSSISAGAQTAILRLERGGQMLICPGTSLSLTSSQNGRQLMFSLSNGNLEMDYPIGAAADNLLTPDFRLLMPGPGRLHVAVRINPKGDTCVQSLPGNQSAIVVSEAMGEASYQVKSDEAVLFNEGHISGAVAMHQGCGCPAPPPSQVAKAAPPPPQPSPAEAKPGADPPPPETHLVIDAPFVYSAKEPVNLTENVVHLRLDSKPVDLSPVVLPPAPGKKAGATAKSETATKAAPGEEKHGLLARIGAFFASIFH